MSVLRKELTSWKEKYGSRTAIQYRDGDNVISVSFEQLISDIMMLENKLRQIDADKVAIVGENSYQWYLMFYASLLAGKKTLICDMLLPLSEMVEVLNIMDVQMVFLSDQLEDLYNELHTCKVSYSVDYFKNIIENDVSKSYTDDLSEEGKIICTTSGTTSKAKGVVIGMEAFVNNNLCLSQLLVGEIGDKVYSPLPMHHMYGVNKTFAYLHMGATLCLGNMRTVEKDIVVFEPDRMLVVPTVIEFLNKRKKLGGSLKSIAVSGCKCDKRIEDICNKYGIFLQNIYGSSESAGGMAMNVPGNAIDELSVIPGREAIIADDGEILIRTDWLMDGYYKNEDATKAKIQDNTLFTEDMGYYDEAGLLHINGRKKDMIAMENGDKIYCEETDEAISSLECVSEAAVIYVDKKLVAVVCPKKGISETVINNAIGEYNRRQQVIRRISKVVISKKTLPRTSTGKLKRNELADWYLNNR